MSKKSVICSDDEDVKEALAAYERIIQYERNLCTRPCRSMAISLKHRGKDVLNNGGGRHKITIMFRPWVKVSRQMVLYPFLSLFAEVGGYTGILCGYSFLYIVQSIYVAINK